MKYYARWVLVMLVLLTFGCAPVTSRSLLELSEKEGKFYRELRPALLEAQETFRITADALITSNATRQAVIMRREAAPDRQVIYKSLAEPNPSTTKVEKAVNKLAKASTTVQAKIDKQKESGKLRIQAIIQTFETLDVTLVAITENHQAIHGYLKAHNRIFGGSGNSTFLPFTTYTELRAHLRESIENLDKQFKLAKELVDAAEKEFSKQGKIHEP